MTPEKFADAIAAHLGIFDRVLATHGLDNLTSGKKRASLISAYGDGGFDYAGQVVVKLKTAGYQVGFRAEDAWAIA